MEIVESLFRPLEDAGVPYCLLRNYEFLTGGKIGNDIDVLVAREYKEVAEEVLAENGFMSCGDESTLHTYYIRLCPEIRTRYVLHVCWDDVMYCSLPIVDGNRLLDTRVLHSTEPVWIPSPESKFVQLVFHCVINRGFYKEKYVDELIELAMTVDRTLVCDHGRDLYGSVGEIVIKLALDGEFEHTLDYKWSLVKSVAMRHPLRIPRFLYVLFIYYQMIKPTYRFNEKHNPFYPKPVIILLGPDGSGKSSLAKALAEDILLMGFDAEVVELGVYNDRSWVVKRLQQLNNMLSGIVDNPFNSYDPETARLDRRQGALELKDRNGIFKSLVYFLDQVWRYINANRTDAEILISDRYLHDTVLYNHYVFSKVLPLFESERTVLYVLDANSEVIEDRSEYDRDSIEEMQTRLSVLPHERIDVSTSLEESKQSIFKCIASSDFIKFFK